MESESTVFKNNYEFRTCDNITVSVQYFVPAWKFRLAEVPDHLSPGEAVSTACWSPAVRRGGTDPPTVLCSTLIYRPLISRLARTHAHMHTQPPLVAEVIPFLNC